MAWESSIEHRLWTVCVLLAVAGLLFVAPAPGDEAVQAAEPGDEGEANDVRALSTEGPTGEQLPTSHGFWVPYMETAAPLVPEGIGPGSWIRVGGHYCTAAFVVADAEGDRYLTTAGHCTDAVGQEAYVLEDALVAGAADWESFGTVVARWPGWNLDAALIEIDDDHSGDVDPSMAGWGGPTGLASQAPDHGFHYGWGWVTWQEHQTRCRDGPSVSWGPTTWWLETTGGGGDSGSGVVTGTGQALGILTWGRQVTYEPVGGAFVAEQLGGVRMDVALDALSADAGLDLQLVTGDELAPVSTATDDAVCPPEPPTGMLP